MFVVEGATLIAEAVRGGWDVLAQYRTADAAPVSGCDADDFVLGEGVLERVASTESPQPNMALVSRRTASLARLEPAATSRTDPWTVFLDAVSDPGNLGTILRSLGWFGGYRCLLSPNSVDPHNPKVVRASMGAIFHVPIEVDVAAHTVAKRYQRLAGLDLQGAPVSSRGFADFDCYVFGNEARGLPREVLAALQAQAFTVPGGGAIESLNLAAVVNMCVYELNRERA